MQAERGESAACVYRQKLFIQVYLSSFKRAKQKSNKQNLRIRDKETNTQKVNILLYTGTYTGNQKKKKIRIVSVTFRRRQGEEKFIKLSYNIIRK